MRNAGLLAALVSSTFFVAACSSGGAATTGTATNGTGGATSSSTSASSSSGATPLPGPPEWNRDVTPPPDDEAAQKRVACAYKAGDLPAETQGASHPNGSDIPIDHIIVLMQENRSFDHYFQKLPEYGQPDVEVAPASYTNPDPDGKPVAPFHITQHCFVDTNHEWSGVHQQVGSGTMDGFYASNEGWHELPVHGTLDMLSGQRALGYHDQTDLPFYYALASEYAIADHYHCSLLGPTWPNRMYLYAASSFGKTDNSFPNADKTLPDYLEQRQLDWKIYGDGTPGYAMFVAQYLKYQADHRRTMADFFADAQAGTLPSVVFLDPKLGAEAYNQNDEHPPAIAAVGQAFVASVVDALTKSPAWSRTALFITYDEHGGLYDHVVPPPACPPDDLEPQLPAGDPPAKFDQLGVRVPLMVVSPYAKKHFVSHRTYDHTSIVRFIQARFVIPALTNRDANAEAPWEMFDFANAPHATPPSIPMPSVDQASVDACAAIYEP